MSSQGGGGVSGGNFPINITGNAAGLDAIIKSVAQYEAQLIRAALASQNFASSASKVGPSLAGNAAGANQFASSMQGANKTLDQFTGSSNSANTAAGTFQRSTMAMGTATGQFATATGQANNSARGFQSTIVGLGQGTGQFANQANSANNSAKGFSSTMVSLGQGTGTFSKSMNEANTSAGGFRNTAIGLGQATGTLKTNLDGTGAGFKEMGDQAETAANKTSSSIQNAGAAVTSMVGKVSGLFIGFTGLKMAMEEAAGMQDMLKAAQEKVAKATERVNEAIKQYGAGSHQATQATQALEKAQNGLAFAERNTNFAIGDTYYFLALLSTQILSSVVPALIQWKDTKAQVNSAIDFLKTSLTELPAKIAAKVAATTADTAAETANAAATNAGGLAKVRATASALGLAIAHKVSAAAAVIHGAAMGALGVAVHALIPALSRLRLAILSNMAVLGPIGAILIAIGLALAALATDFMGSRTALEGFGKSLGDAVPVLKPFLEGIQGIGGALGLTGETAEETQTHFDRMTIGFQNMGTLWNDTVALMQNSNIALVQDIGFTVAGVSSALSTMNTEFEGQINMSIDTWNKFVHALSQGDFEGAVDILTEALSAIPGILSQIGLRVGQLVDEIAKGLRAIGTDLYAELSKVSAALQGLFGEIGKRIVTWLGNIAADVINWVNTNVVEPILGFLDSIGIPATEIWTAIVGAAGNMAATVQAWVTENIVNPVLAWIDSVQGDPVAIWNAISGGAGSIISNVTAWVTENIVNPILAFIDSISVEPATIWTSIVGSATALLSTVTTWVKTNIVDPILDIPNQVSDIISKVVAKLGFGASTPGEVMTWVVNIALQIMSIPGKIVGKAVEIVRALLSGDWAGEVKTFLDNVWKALTGWIPGMGSGTPGVTSGIPGGGQVTKETPGASGSETPLDPNTVKDPKTGMFVQKTPQMSGQSNSTPGVSSGGPLLYQPGNASAGMQELQTQRALGVKGSDPWARFGTKTDPFASTVKQPPPMQQPSGGFRNVADSAYLQQNKDTKKLQSSGMDLNQLTDETKAIKEQAASYAQAEANLNEWTKGIDNKQGTSEKHLALGAQEILQQKDMIGVYGGNKQAVEDLGAQIEAKNVVLENAEKKNAELRGSIVGTTLAMADGTLQGKLSEQGYLEQTAALQKMEMETIKNTSSLNTYSKQLQDGRIQQVAFTLGEQEQEKALYDKEVALNKNAGKLTEYANQLNEGKILSLAFAEGQQAITQEYLTMIEETSNLNGKFAELSVKINDVSQRQIVYNNGLAEGQLAAAKFIQEIDRAAGAYEGYRRVLIENAQAMDMTVSATMLGTKAIEDFVAVARGSPEAIKELHGWVIELGNSMKNDLAAAAKEGSDELEDAFDDLEDKIGFKLGGEVKTTLEFAANIENALQEVEAGLGTLSMVIQFGADASQIRDVGKGILDNFEATFENEGDNIGNGIIDNLDKNFKNGAVQIRTIFEQLKTNIETIMNSPVGSDAFNTAFQNIKNLMGSLRGDVDNLGQGFNALGGSMQPPITSASQLGQKLKEVGDNGKLNLEFTNNWSQAADVFTGSATKAAQATNDWGTFQDAWRGKADQGITSASQLAQNIDKVGTAATTAANATNNWSTFQSVWNGNVASGVTSANQLAGGIEGTGTAASTAQPQVQQFYDTIANFGTIESVAITIFTQKLPEHAATGAAAMAVAFQGLSAQIAPTFGEIENLAIVVFATNIPNHAAAGIPFIVAAFSLMTPNIAPYFGELEVLAMTIMAVNIPMHAATGIPFIVAAFSLLPSNIAPFFGELDSLTQTILEVNIPAHAAAMNPLVVQEFGNMLTLATNHLLVLAQNADKTFKAIAGFAVVVPQAVDREFGKAADDGIRLFQALQRGVEQACNAMVTAIGRVASAIGNIQSSANSAKSAVDSLKSAIDSLKDKTVTITYRQVTTGSAPSGARRGQFGLHTQVNEPTWFLAGEGSGVETVQITPGTIVGKNNNVNVDVQHNSQSNVGGSGSIVQSSVNNQVNGVRTTPTTGTGTLGTGSTNNSGAITVTNGNQTITIGADGTVSITQGNQTIITGPNGTNISQGGGIRNANPNPSDVNNQNGTVVSGGNIVGQNNNTNVQTDTNTNSNVGGSGTITQTQTNTQNPPGVNQQTQTNTGTSNTSTPGQTNTQSGPGFSQSSTVVSGSGRSIGSGHNISYQRNNSGETLMVDGQTYQAVSQQPTTSTHSPSETEFRRRRQTGSNAGPGVRTVVEQPLEINVHVDRWKLGRAVRKLMYDMEEGLYK